MRSLRSCRLWSGIAPDCTNCYFNTSALIAVILSIAFWLAAPTVPASAEPGPFLQPGTVAPSTSIEDLSGTKHQVPATGTWSLVFFWSLFCHTCLDEIPHLIEETAHLASPSCRPFFISLDSTRMKKGLQNFLNKRRLTATILVDEVASAAYLSADQWGVRMTPSVFLVDPGGVIRYSRAGPFDLQEMLTIMKQCSNDSSAPSPAVDPASGSANPTPAIVASTSAIQPVTASMPRTPPAP